MVDAVHIGGKVTHDLLLICIQFHAILPLQFRNIARNFLKGDVIFLQFRITEGAEVSVNHISVCAGANGVQERAVQGGDSLLLIIEIVGTADMNAEEIRLVRIWFRQTAFVSVK